MSVRPDLETATSISVAGCEACTCGAIAVRLHDRRGDIFAAALIGPAIAEAFLEQVRATVAQQRAGGLGAIRCEGTA